MSLKSREEEEEEDVANNLLERQQEREQQPNNPGLMNTAAFFSNFGETFSQVSNIAKEKAEILKEQMRLAQTTTTSSSRKEHFGEQEREEEQKNQQAGAEKKKNKGDYVRLPIESAKRLRALDTRDVNELEVLHKAQIAKVLAENELLREKLKQSTTSENGEEEGKENFDAASKKCAEIETATNRVLVVGLKEQVNELETEMKEIEEDLEVSRENTKKCKRVLEDVEANYQTCQTQRDALKQEVEDLRKELVKASSLSAKLEEEKLEMQKEMKEKTVEPPPPPPPPREEEKDATSDVAAKKLQEELKSKEDAIASLKDQLAKMTENAKVSASKKNEEDSKKDQTLQSKHEKKLKVMEDTVSQWKKAASENLSQGETKLENALEEAREEKKQFQSEIKTLESRVKEAEETAKKFETLANDAMDWGRQLESEANETGTKQLEEMKEKLKESKETSREYSRRVRELEQELVTTRDDLQDAKTVANESKTKSETKLAAIEQQLKSMKEQKDDFEMQKNEAVSEMEAMRLDMELEFEQRLEQRSDKTKENARLEIERKDLLNSLELKEKELKRCLQSFEGKANELDEAKKELSEFKREYSALENQMKTIVSEQKHNNAAASSHSVSSSREEEDEMSLVSSLETALKRAKESKATAMDTIKELKKELETLKLEFDAWRKKARKIMTEKDAECDELRKLSGTGAGAGGVIGSRNSSFSSLKAGDDNNVTSSNRGLDKQEFGYIKAVVLKFLMCDEWTQQEAVLKIIISLFNIDEDPSQLKKVRDARRFLEPTPISTAEVSLAKYSEESVNYFTNDILGYGDII
jgi:chromosome segregation ATPase